MKRSGAAIWVGVIVLAGVARGQVVRTQTGRLLDANYGVGRSRINSLRQVDRPVDGNMLITGQVTGGYGFRGQVEYYGANQLRLDVPSAGLDGFLSRSAGLAQVVGSTGYGHGYGPAPYLSPSTTVLGAAGIAGGMAVPGTSIPRPAYAPSPEARRLIDSAVGPYRPLLADTGRRLEVNTALGPAVSVDAGTGQPGAPGVPTSAGLDYAGAVRPASSALFGILRGQDRQRLAEELTEDEKLRRQYQVDSRVDGVVEARPVDARGDADEPGTRQQPEPQPAEAPPKAPTGQDVFFDVLVLYNQLQNQPAPAAPVEPAPSRRPQRTGQPDETPEQAQQRRDSQRDRESVRRMHERLVIHRLAGASAGEFNLRMRQGEALLAQGKYYNAADTYELAAILGPSNPLPCLGLALARFAANEPLSSAFALRQGMRRFPPLMEVGVDVNRLLGNKVIDLRAGQLETRIAGLGDRPEASLVFLATFVRHVQGKRKAALANATRLEKLAGTDALYRTYAKYVLTGKAPRAARAAAKTP